MTEVLPGVVVLGLMAAVALWLTISRGGVAARAAVFGLAPLSLPLFISFNLAWLGIWALSAWGLARRRQVAPFPLWFLGIAGVANGLLHPLLALNAGSYFPGLVTSPLMAAVGALLLARLSRVTG